LAREIYIFINNNCVKKILKNLPKSEKYILFKANEAIIKILGQGISHNISHNYNKNIQIITMMAELRRQSKEPEGLTS
jgi:hypothetical protein